MRLHEELCKGVDALTGARYTVAVQGGGYFQGVKTVGEFSETGLVLYFPRCAVEVEGNALVIQKYADGDLQLGGTITCVRVAQVEGGATK